MLGLSIAMFIVAIIMWCRIYWDKGAEDQLTRGEKTLEMLCYTIAGGIILYWTRNIFLFPITEMYDKYVDRGMLFLAVVLGLLCIDYMCALGYQLPRIPFIAIGFVMNCLVAAKAPIVSVAIVFIFMVCTYGVIHSKNLRITLLETALIKAMMATSAILTVLKVIGIIPSIIILLVIMALTTTVSVTIEVIVFKKTTNDEKPKNFPAILTSGVVQCK